LRIPYPRSKQALAVGVVGFVGEHSQVRKARQGLQAQVGDLLPRFFLLHVGHHHLSEVALADGFFLDPDLFGIGHHHIEVGTTDDRNVLLTIAGEGEFDGSSEGLIEPRRQDLFVRHGRKLAERLDDGFPGGEDERICHERAIRILDSHREFGGNDGSNENRLAGTHRQGENVAWIGQSQRFAKRFEFVAADKVIVRANPLEQILQFEIHLLEGHAWHSQRFDQIAFP